MAERKLVSKSECIAFCASLPNKGSPLCPYMGLSCRNFYINLASGICSQDGVRCSWLPSWVTSVSDCFAILKKDGRLHAV